AGETDKCIAAGMDDYISKPFDEKVLYSKINSVLKRKKGTGHMSTIENGNIKYTDLSYLKQLAKGSNEFIKQMLSIFIDQTPPAIESLEENFNKKDWVALRAAAHKMKPSFSFVGIKELEPVIKEIEECAEKESELDSLPEKISKIRQISIKAIVELEKEKNLL
ncbi:MAG: Hpt domain-containing protein, partial [Nitrosopumilus sp.]|nr:Hpt domain-containing protein [Nitrosopumilus sp.]